MVIAAGTMAFPSAGTARPASEVPAAAAPRDRDALKADATRNIPTFGGSYLDGVHAARVADPAEPAGSAADNAAVQKVGRIGNLNVCATGFAC